MEHVTLTRLNSYMNDNGLYPHTVIGFRPKLSTQDVMLQIKHRVIDAGTADAKAILGLDLAKAFDNVSHKALLENLQDLGAGERTSECIKDFPSERTAEITIGEIRPEDIRLGSRGTPQGSVLSPFLFNVAMIKLRRSQNYQFITRREGPDENYKDPVLHSPRAATVYLRLTA